MLTPFPESAASSAGEDSGSSDGDLDAADWDLVSEAEGTEEHEERHGDHVDTHFFTNPFGNEWTAAWHNCWYVKAEDSLTNDQIYDSAVTQWWMDALTSVNRDAISLLVEYRTGLCQLPLFKDKNGWEYQIGLSLGQMNLPSIYCPHVLATNSVAAPLFELKARMQAPETARATEQAPALPRFAVQLGGLGIRNGARYPQSFTVPTTITEGTDYSVVVDVESKDLPLWILAPRSQQQLRVSGPYTSRSHPKRPLPIFNGLLENDDVGYDCACILPSVRLLGNRPPSADGPSFDEACELIRKTRATIDPAGLRYPMDKVKEFNGGMPVPRRSQTNTYSDPVTEPPVSTSVPPEPPMSTQVPSE